METTIKIPDKLIPKIKEAARHEGYKETGDDILSIIQDRLTELSLRRKIVEITDRVRDALETKGISEGDIQGDFEEFRNKLRDE